MSFCQIFLNVKSEKYNCVEMCLALNAHTSGMSFMIDRVVTSQPGLQIFYTVVKAISAHTTKVHTLDIFQQYIKITMSVMLIISAWGFTACWASFCKDRPAMLIMFWDLLQ